MYCVRRRRIPSICEAVSPEDAMSDSTAVSVSRGVFRICGKGVGGRRRFQDDTYSPSRSERASVGTQRQSCARPLPKGGLTIAYRDLSVGRNRAGERRQTRDYLPRCQSPCGDYLTFRRTASTAAKYWAIDLQATHGCIRFDDSPSQRRSLSVSACSCQGCRERCRANRNSFEAR